MLRKTTSLEAVATIGIDIGKNAYHLISLDKMGARPAPEVVAQPDQRSARQHAALPDRHGGVRWGASPESATQGVRPRCTADAGRYRSARVGPIHEQANRACAEVLVREKSSMDTGPH
jgi:hypothetical protein